jgi:hypothetical protein
MKDHSGKGDKKMKGILIILFIILAVSLIGTLTQEVDFLDEATPVRQILEFTQPETTAAAASIEVDRDDDPNELLPCTAAANDCSLHSAIAQANDNNVATTITFADHYLITLARPLPILSASDTIIRARPDQEVHINGNNIAQSVFYVTGANVMLEGLRVYGAGAGYSNISIGGGAYNVSIARNVIGDDDATSGACGQSDQAYGGIYVGGTEVVPTDVRAWIYGNIIECHRGGPGDGITVATDKVIMGQDSAGTAGPAQRNTFRWNRGFGVRVGDYGDNVICNSLMHDNETGNMFMTNFDNDFMDNELH